MIKNTQSRNYLVSRLQRELIGPAPEGVPLDCSQPVIFKDAKETFRSFVQKDTGEEILQRDSPLNRYGTAILYPAERRNKKSSAAEETNPLRQIVFTDEPGASGKLEKEVNEPGENSEHSIEDELPGDANRLDLADAHKRLPNSMGLSFLVKIPERGQLVVNAAGGRFRMQPMVVGKEKHSLWLREQVEVTAKFGAIDEVFTPRQVPCTGFKTVNAEGLKLAVEVFARPTSVSNHYLITVALINRTPVAEGKMPDSFALFQAGFSVRVISPSGNRNILPYPDAADTADRSEEEQSLSMLYRTARPFGVGHGCSAEWDREVAADERVEVITATSFPVFEVPNFTSEVKCTDGRVIEISMAKLAGRVPGDDGFAELAECLDEYAWWIERREKQIPQLAARYHATAHRHLKECRRVHERMREGLRLLKTDARARETFRLANDAMLMQQHRSKLPLRQVSLNRKTGKISFSRGNTDPDLFASGSGRWRAFQIGFLLLSLRSAIDPTCEDRETVELIWFATGGGKTEAYLLLVAFTIFYRRLCDPQDAGTAAFMRYTLRLLTAQQFQRTGALICAMESIRRTRPQKLGAAEISIGLWLGNEVTPRSRHDARHNLKQLQENPRWTENKFILNRCPWCAAELGKVTEKPAGKKRGGGAQNINVFGYRQAGGTVILHCPDETCLFHEQLPVYVTDEDLYAKRPTFFISTVDKFALLALRPEARALFGFDQHGNRLYAPPWLIIQDELHLISGPLGTMVALYESVVEELCTDRRSGVGVRPKIIAATATTRAYREQIRSVFARDRAQLFPPPGIDAGNSFFAREARDAQGRRLPGRLYVGINAPGLGSVQNTEVRTYTALIQAAGELPSAERDAYWTLMAFFSSLQWLGNTVSLFQANVQLYFFAYKNRTRQEKIRHIRSPLELTGNLRGDEVLAALKKLEVNYTENSSQAVDVCLCSSIAEVGVDVSRLALMTIVSQPKTTAQYIQISSRIGRDPEHPGLVVVIYNPSKARDRSHFERFRSYHEQLYAQVEPVSATPFAPPALERALHAVMSAFVRQTGTQREAGFPYPVPEERLAAFKDILLRRLQLVAPEQRAVFERIFNRRVAEWRAWEPTSWLPDLRNGEATELLRPIDRWADEFTKSRSWATPVSMRTVDPESELRITHYYQSPVVEPVSQTDAE